MRNTSFGLIWVLLAGSSSLAAQPWGGYGRDAQHSGVSPIAAQTFGHVNWSTPVDTVLAGQPGDLLIHYGTPVITAGNTILIPVRTSSSNTYQVSALNAATGASKYTLTTDYTPPAHDWIPSYGPVLSARNRFFWPGAGGTVYYRDSPDSNSGPSGQIAFYGSLSNYQTFAADYNSKVMISTPIVSDQAGNIFFGFIVTGTTQTAGLVSGLARISSTGAGSWVSALALAGGDSSITQIPLNCAPAITVDGNTVYVGLNSGGNSAGYLASASNTLAPIARIQLVDPSNSANAAVPDNASASPTIGPDGDVYYGTEASSPGGHNARGWMMHFNGALTTTKTPGAFGWDTTASIVAAGLVSSYTGSSSYLILTKYNNYAGQGSGDGLNKVALLDPNATQPDPVGTGALVMKEVITVLGPTADPQIGGVKEWCINSAAIDVSKKSAIINSEDGTVYRWDFGTNTLSESLVLTGGVGEAYTPTVIGPDGTLYAINDATLWAVTASPTPPSMVSFSVVFGSASYNLTGSTRVHLPWQITGIRVVFSQVITTASQSSLTGVNPTSLTGLGTNTLTWTISPLSLATGTATLVASTISNAAGQLNGGANVNQAYKILWGDFNDDGVVNSSDLAGVNGARSSGYNIFADLDGDLAITVTDVNLVRARLGTSNP